MSKSQRPGRRTQARSAQRAQGRTTEPRQRTAARSGRPTRQGVAQPSAAPKDSGVQAVAAARPSGTSVVGKIGDRLSDFLSRPSVDYTMLLIITGALTFIGLIMAASITGPSSFYDDSGRYISGASVYGQFFRQAIMVTLGLVSFYFALRIPPTTLRRLSPWVIGLALFLLLLVFTPIGIGEAEKGSQSWLKLGPLRLQPSEVAKLALVMWGADILAGISATAARRRNRPRRWDSMATYTVMLVLIVVLILLEKDLGMAITVLVVGGIVAFLAGVGYSTIAGAGAFGGAVAIFYILRGHGGGSNFRASRLTTFIDAFTGNFTNTQSEAFQSYQGFLSLAEGGLFGVGVGQSRAKWFYLPEAKNDFVFAIVGEELGTVGAIAVLLLFAGLGFFGMRAATRNADPYLRLLAGGLTLGIVFQAMYNIGYVVGLLPVTGIQLPLISVGGTSTIITLASLGLVANCARHEPETVSAIQDRGRSNFDKWLFLPAPKPFVPAAPADDSLQRRHTGVAGRGRRDGADEDSHKTARQLPVTARSKTIRGDRSSRARVSSDDERQRRSGRGVAGGNARRDTPPAGDKGSGAVPPRPRPSQSRRTGSGRPHTPGGRTGGSPERRRRRS
ncbi:FtsW/RodA/SpoVE family cell cycle protein [Corynebacterium aquilae]|uniref:FtsW/RodA/SpoVE family cell cycle protein n=1 Tax=Corynebacterium aquilae TaxID=203263 RepID=UPI000A06AF70|nr:putative peptidoglycan glycosyltransferase FtsW [Corynebacterium aquilae]